VDIDSDGIPDVLSGSWPGQLYFFKGKGNGAYAIGTYLKHIDGKDINLGRASTVFAVDWRGTGKFDLLVGNVVGDIWLVPNEGTHEKPAYGNASKLEVMAGKPLRVMAGDSHPIAADWDRDGKLDLLVGTGDGGVILYRNIGDAKVPKLALAQTLVPDRKHNDQPPSDSQSGFRAKIYVTDWNGDGLPDLLLGDFDRVPGPPRKLSEKDQRLQKETLEQARTIPKETKFFELSNRLDEIRNTLAAGKGDTKALTEERVELEAGVQRIAERLLEIRRTLSSFEPPEHYAGNVWLFLRRAQPIMP
jgi:hypothetical protein